jgi:hypothetical protein
MEAIIVHVCCYMQWKMISMRWRIYENEANDCTKVTIEKRAWGDSNEEGREGGREGEREKCNGFACMHMSVVGELKHVIHLNVLPTPYRETML